MKTRKIFFVMAGGGHETDKHYHDTIENKRSVNELTRFLTDEDIKKLQKYSRGRSYAIWGAVHGPSNVRNWESMNEGDYVMVYRKKKVILVAEIARKVKNTNLAEYLWGKDTDGKTWEYVYFMINEVVVDIDIEKINKYFKYEPDYCPRGFMAIEQEKATR